MSCSVSKSLASDAVQCRSSAARISSALIGPPARTSMRCVSRQFGRVQYSAVEYHLRDLGIGVNRLRRILPEQEQIGTFSDLHGTDFPIQLQCPGVRQRRGLEDLRRSFARLDEPMHLQPSIEARWIGVGGGTRRIGAK